MTSFVIQSPTRLHFGLLSFGSATGRNYGGAGVMLESPQVALSCSSADEFKASGPLCDRLRDFSEMWSRYHSLALPSVELTVEDVAPQHAGLGVGTQLGLCVATALRLASGMPTATAVELSESVGRARRSCVGTYGFLQGGLIVERGHNDSERISPLDCRVEPPDTWRVVLIRPKQHQAGLSGQQEKDAFDSSPTVSQFTSNELATILRDSLIPAVTAGDFQVFSESLFRYGYTAGMCFAGQQGGPYNGPVLNQLVDEIREMGISGVGQSSWGPTLFAWLEDEQEASQFVADFTDRHADCELSITKINTAGHRIHDLAAQ